MTDESVTAKEDLVAMSFNEWLDEQLGLQVDAYSVDPTALEGEELAEYIRWNTLALLAESVEALNCIQWKPWATKEVQGKEVVQHEELVEEMADMMFFIGNLLLAYGITGEELAKRYRTKLEINAVRQQEGYSPERYKAHREVFYAHQGMGPWICYFCQELVLLRGDLHVHHVNKDHHDNDPSNLVAAHARCHLSDANKKPKSKDHRRAIKLSWESRRLKYGPDGGSTGAPPGLRSWGDHRHYAEKRYTDDPRLCDECSLSFDGEKGLTIHFGKVHKNL